jgi:hypothetical protein
MPPALSAVFALSRSIAGRVVILPAPDSLGARLTRATVPMISWANAL